MTFLILSVPILRTSESSFSLNGLGFNHEPPKKNAVVTFYHTLCTTISSFGRSLVCDLMTQAGSHINVHCISRIAIILLHLAKAGELPSHDMSGHMFIVWYDVFIISPQLFRVASRRPTIFHHGSDETVAICFVHLRQYTQLYSELNHDTGPIRDRFASIHPKMDMALFDCVGMPSAPKLYRIVP